MSRRATGDEGGYFFLGKPFAPLYQSTNLGLKNMNIMRKVMIWNMLIVSVIFFSGNGSSFCYLVIVAPSVIAETLQRPLNQALYVLQTYLK